jgi:hypothetical protein
MNRMTRKYLAPLLYLEANCDRKGVTLANSMLNPVGETCE